MMYLISALVMSIAFVGVVYNGVYDSIYYLFDWSGNTGTIEKDFGSSMIPGPQNILQYGIFFLYSSNALS